MRRLQSLPDRKRQIPGQGEGGPVPLGDARAPIANPHYNIVDARGKAVAATTDTTSGTHENAIHVPGLSFQAAVQPLLAKNCALCHNEQMKTAEVDFTQFKTDADAERGIEVWEKAVEKLRNGSMPPQGLPRPKQADIDVVMKWMDAAIVRAASAPSQTQAGSQPIG